jgi:hypothetical protein
MLRNAGVLIKSMQGGDDLIYYGKPCLNYLEFKDRIEATLLCRAQKTKFPTNSREGGVQDGSSSRCLTLSQIRQSITKNGFDFELNFMKFCRFC